MKKFLLLLNLILIINSVQSQTWQWASRGGGSDGDSSPSVSEDEKIKDMAVDSQGNIYVTGRIRSNANINGTSVTTYGGYDIFLAKFNCTGDLIWAQTAGGNNDDEGNGIALSSDGNLYVTGKARSSPINTFYMGDTSITENSSDYFLAKFDTSGNFKWLKIASPGSSNIVSAGYGIGANNNMINTIMRAGTAGFFEPGFPVTAQRDYLIKINNSGNTIAVDTMTGQYHPNDNIIFDQFGNYFFSGVWSNSFSIGSTTYAPQGITDLIVIKYDNNANLQWVYTQGISGQTATVRGIDLDAQGNLYVTGTIANGFVFGNDTMSNSGSTSFPFTAKINSNGQSIWGTNPFVNNASFGTSITSDLTGNVYSSILLYGTGTFGSQTIISTGQANSVLVKYDSNGNTQWAEMLNSTGGTEDRFTVLKPDNAGNIYLGGSFKNTVTINGNLTFSAGGKTDFLLVKHGGPTCTVGIEENELVNTYYGIHAYPNPSKGKFLIRLEKFIPNQNDVVSVYNSIGQLIKEEKIKFPGIATIDITRVPSGIYHIRAFNGEKYMSTKVVVSE